MIEFDFFFFLNSNVQPCFGVICIHETIKIQQLSSKVIHITIQSYTYHYVKFVCMPYSGIAIYV